VRAVALLILLSGVEQVSCAQMALVYRKSTRANARKYARSPGMEPNTGGVTHMTVINPGRPPRSNPFQWIRGSARGNHKHLSPSYRTVRGARGWAEKHVPESARAKLVAIDEYGTIMARPMSRKQVLRNTGRRSMAYNLKALRRAMRKNMTAADREAVKAAARGIDVGRASTKSRSRKSRPFSGPGAALASMTKAQRKRHSKALSQMPGWGKSSSTKVSGGKVTAKAATKAAKSASTQAKVASKAATRAKKTTSKKVASKAAKVAKKAASKAKAASKKATSKAKKAKPSSKKAANKAAAKARREAKKAASAAAAAVSASKKAQRRGRLSRKHGSFKLTSKAHGRYRRVKGFSASPFRTGRLFNPPYIHITSKHPKRRAAGIRMAANMLGRVSQRKGLPSGQRVQLVEFGPRSKRKGYAVYVPGHVSERAYVRKFHFGGAAADAHSRAMRSGYSKKRYSKKRVSANGRSSMRRNSRKRHSKKHVSRNKRHSRKRHSKKLRGNRYFLARNRRVRRNFSILGIDPITQVAIPGAYAVGGLMVANAAANAAAAMPALTNMLDAGRADPIVTKSLAGALGAGLTLAFAGKLPAMLRANITPIVAGMGCAVAVRLLRGTQAAPYLGRWGAGFGEYVDQPLGAYVQDPSMGEYVDQPLGEYVDQPLGGLGATMYAAAGMGDQDASDALLDGAEESAGVGVFQAAAGMGQTMYAAAGMGETMYAAAGLGAGEPGVVGSPIPIPTYTPPVGPGGHQQPPFISMTTPIDQANLVTGTMVSARPVKTGIVTSEGRTGEGGIFSRSIFGGSMG
jgi:histone H1/5